MRQFKRVLFDALFFLCSYLRRLMLYKRFEKPAFFFHSTRSYIQKLFYPESLDSHAFSLSHRQIQEITSLSTNFLPQKTPLHNTFVCFPPFYFEDRGTTRQSIHTGLPATGVLQIKGVEVISGSSFILPQNDSKNAYIHSNTYQPIERIDYNTYNAVQPGGGKDIYIEHISSSNTRRITEGIMLSGQGSENYYHWLMEYLPRLLLISNGNIDLSVPLLVDEKCINISQLHEALVLFNTEKRDTYKLRFLTRYQVDKLYYPLPINHSAFNIAPPNIFKTTDSLLNPDTVDFLREKTQKIRIHQSDAQRKIYLSRKSHQRRSFNEGPVERVFADHGFDIVYPQMLTFAQQVELFSSARFIAGATGGAMTNIIFAPHNARILCLMPGRFEFAHWSNIASVLGQRLIHLAGKPTFLSRFEQTYEYQKSFTVDIPLLERAVEDLLSN